MNRSLASAITKTASKQTYYTIRFLVDRGRAEDAYRAYAYFRWVDDVLDAEAPALSAAGAVDRRRLTRFLDQQRSLLDRCLRGEVPRNITAHESMLVDLVRASGCADNGLNAYLRHMMLVMDFDLRRRGRLVTGAELTRYTRWLAIAVTEAMHYFIGGDGGARDDGRRYLAAAGAHIVHMLRDTYEDMRIGYFNVPRELLDAHSIDVGDVDSEPYRAWVERRVRLARAYFDAGRAYLPQVRSRRHRLAILAYIARFMWLTDKLEKNGFVLERGDAQRRGLSTGLRMALDVVCWAGRA